MGWPFDPWNAWRRRPGPTGRPEQAWLDVRAEATRWWVEPALRGAQDAATLDERLLGDLLDGLIARFEGQPVDLVVGGRRMRAVLDLIRLRSRGGRFEGRLELRDVEWAGWAFEQLGARAASVRIEPAMAGAGRIDAAPAAPFTVSGIELAGRMASEPGRLPRDAPGHRPALRAS